MQVTEGTWTRMQTEALFPPPLHKSLGMRLLHAVPQHYHLMQQLSLHSTKHIVSGCMHLLADN